ncbi:MAG TPA: hypothetical protein VNO81_11825 [Candidatus Nitrosotenuis sp.]|jgi:hypothetical protein|nr:hypothetical protein [Candidatus Nitrosotenuis sp.]
MIPPAVPADEGRGAAPYPAAAAAQKFEALRRQALVRSLLGLFGKPREDLLSFDQVHQLVRDRVPIPRGLQNIPIASIVGSVGRYRDFDRAFLPLHPASEERWKRLDIAMNELRSLPPIDVYKVGEVYFVRDGNHRVSVARANGLETIEAWVTEIPVRVPLTPDTDVDDLILKIEYSRFLETTGLDRSRPDHRLEVTEPGRHQILLEHIEVHRYYLGLEQGREVSLEEAAASWYDHVYLPVVEALRETRVMEEFPQRTETDLYLWVAHHRERLREQYGEMPADREVAERLASDYSERPLRGLVKAIVRALRAAARAFTETPGPPPPGESP